MKFKTIEHSIDKTSNGETYGTFGGKGSVNLRIGGYYMYEE
jgi:hypothetical protein